MNLKPNKISAEDRRNVLIALTATQPAAPVGACLTDEELAQFADHRMSHAERLSVLDHIDSCRDCYARWADVVEEVPAGWTERLNFWKKPVQGEWSISGRRAIIAEYFNRWKKPVMSVAFAAAVCLVLILLRQPDVNTMLDDAYRMVNDQSIAFGNNALSLPWQQPRRRYGFIAAKPDTDLNRAFGAGLHSGRQALTRDQGDEAMPAYLAPRENAAKWTDTTYAGYFYLGRQSFLIRAVCKSEQPPQYPVVKKLTTILAHIRLDYFKEMDANIAPSQIVNNLLKKMQSDLGAIDTDYYGRQKYRELADAADALIDELRPMQMKAK